MYNIRVYIYNCSASVKENTTDNHKSGHKKSRHKADVRKELAKAYENIGSKV